MNLLGLRLNKTIERSRESQFVCEEATIDKKMLCHTARVCLHQAELR